MKVIHMPVTRLLSWILPAAVLPMLAACDHKQVEDSTLNIDLAWDHTKPDLPPGFIGDGDGTADIDIEDIAVWIHKADNSLFNVFHFSGVRELSEQQFNLPAGEYRIFSTVNLLPPYIDEYNPAPTRSYTDGEDHFITLEKSNLSPAAAFCCENNVVIAKNSKQSVKVTMKEILSEMTFIIQSIPRGTTFIGSVENAAAGITPKFDNTAGDTVAEKSEQKVPVELPTLVSKDGTLTIKNFRLLPSVKGATETLIKIRLIYPSTKLNDFEIHAPVMNMGGKYHIAFDFGDMSPIMYLTPVKINDWTEKWSISGEILNPEETR